MGSATSLISRQVTVLRRRRVQVTWGTLMGWDMWQRSLHSSLELMEVIFKGLWASPVRDAGAIDIWDTSAFNLPCSSMHKSRLNLLSWRCFPHCSYLPWPLKDLADSDLEMKDCHLTGHEHPSVRLSSELLIQSMTTSFHPRRGTKESYRGPKREDGFWARGQKSPVKTGFLRVETPPVPVLFWRQAQWHHSGGSLTYLFGTLQWNWFLSAPFPVAFGRKVPWPHSDPGPGKRHNSPILSLM